MKSILITGASSGIGRSTAELFLKDGWRVGVIARRRALLEEIAANYDNAVVLSGDVTDHAAMQSAFAEFIKKTSHLDAVFNNVRSVRRAQPIDATHSAHFSAGVWYCKVFLGRSLSCIAIALSFACEWADRSVPRGRYCLRSRLVFSFDPRCHGDCGSQK